MHRSDNITFTLKLYIGLTCWSWMNLLFKTLRTHNAIRENYDSDGAYINISLAPEKNQ